jgi:hypothetical protein
MNTPLKIVLAAYKKKEQCARYRAENADKVRARDRERKRRDRAAIKRAAAAEEAAPPQTSLEWYETDLVPILATAFKKSELRAQ